MKKIFLTVTMLGCITIGAMLSSCTNEGGKSVSSPAFNLDSVKASIAASNKAYGECFATGDSVKFVSCYTADACIFPPNMPKMCGTQAINGFFNGAVKMGIRNIKITTEEVYGNDSTASEVGKYDVMADKDVSLEKGKFIVVWKKVNSTWKMHRDVWNSDTTPPAVPAEKK